MSNLRLGVVDTGFKEFSNILLPKKSFGISVVQHDGTNNCLLDFDTTDHHGHGTEVESLLAAFCPEVEIVPVRIAQIRDGNCIPFVPEDVLALGIEWCVDNHIRLVNISYSIEKVNKDGPLVTVCRKAADNDIILVAAYRNAIYSPVYPAAFPTVIGVSIRKDLDHAQIAIVSEINHDVAAFGGPYRITTPDAEQRIVCGTSFATAQITGMVARILAIKPQLALKEVFRYLKKYSSP